jgi:hypothetical protein
MKKGLLQSAICLLLVGVMLCCSGCFRIKVYEASDKTFSTQGLTITLTSAFIETSGAKGYTACYDSPEVAVFALKESFDLQDGFGDLLAEEYAALVREANSDKNPSPVSDADGLLSIEYSFLNTVENKEFTYYTAMFKGEDAFWMVQFACESSLYEEYRPHFIKWAKTVDVFYTE